MEKPMIFPGANLALNLQKAKARPVSPLTMISLLAYCYFMGILVPYSGYIHIIGIHCCFTS